MSIYSEVLRMALASDEDPQNVGGPVTQLVARLAEARAHLLGAEEEHGRAPVDLVERMARELEHDVALVRLCFVLGIEEHLTDPTPPLDERARLLRLVERHEVTGEHEVLAAEGGPAGSSLPCAQVSAPGEADASASLYSPGWDLRP